MWQSFVDAIKRLFSRSGGIQVGRGNAFISGVSVGDDASGVIVAHQVNITPPTTALPDTYRVQLTADDVELLRRMAQEPNSVLSVQGRGGMPVLKIDDVPVTPTGDRSRAIAMYDAFERLCRFGFLVTMQPGGSLFYLSPDGFQAAQQVGR